MKTSVRIPASLRTLTGGEASVEAGGGTVAELVDDLDKRFSGVRKRLFDENDRLRASFDIFVNDADIRSLQHEKTPLHEGDEIAIVPAITGGKDEITAKIILTLKGKGVSEPLIYTIGQRFQVVTNIQGASIAEGVGFVALELTGSREEVNKAIQFLEQKNAKIQRL